MTTAPLTDLVVVEFSPYIAGPYAGLLLSDLGATVIKVEPPGGDALRQWVPRLTHEDGTESSLTFIALNRGKQSIAIDLKSPQGRDEALRLCAMADVVLQSYRPGAMNRLGLGYEDVRAVRPGIVYCAVSGYGQAGPLRSKGAFDIVVQGYSGLMSVTGDPEGSPTKSGVPIADFMAGAHATVGILAALASRSDRPEGQFIDCSLLGSMLSVSAIQTSELWATGTDPVPLGSAHPHNAPYRAYQAIDGWFTVAVGNDRLWERFCDALDLGELRVDPRFSTAGERAKHQASLDELLSPRLSQLRRDDVLHALDERGIPSGPVLRYSELLASTQVREAGWLTSVPVAAGADAPAIMNTLRVGDWSPKPDPAPELDAHRDRYFPSGSSDS